MPSKLCYFLLLIVAVIALHSCKSKEATNEQPPIVTQDTIVADTLVKYQIPLLDSAYLTSFFNTYKELKGEYSQVVDFYNTRNYNCAWFNSYGLTEQTGKVINLVTDYIESGIVDTTILIPGIVSLLDSIRSETFTPEGNDSLILYSDVLFTTQFFIFSRTAWKGVHASKVKNLEWFLPVNKSTEVAYLDSILSAPPSEIAGTEPVFKQYLLLKGKIKEYSEIQKNGGWDSLPSIIKSIQVGDSSDFLIAFKNRLKVTGDYGLAERSPVMDSAFASVVFSVRNRFGLSAEPVIDAKLIKQLNVSVATRIRQIMINLERWKWVPPDPGKKFIAVNIPEYMLHVFENGTNIKSMKVIVGKAANKTVIFSGDLKYVVLSPYWIIGGSILAKETLPAVKRNPSYLSKHNMEVVTNSHPPKVVNPSSIDWNTYTASNFPYIIRQKPGPSNSLGYVKFLFPNSYSIYLHDTPTRSLFEKEGRTFSHGCIRIAEPAWLANYLLRDNPNWNEESIDMAMHGGKEQYVTLKKTVPVYITYFTAWIDKHGHLNFRDDIYQHDAKLAKEIFK